MDQTVVTVYLQCGSGLSPLNSHLFVVSEEKVKDYRYYLRMWAKEKEPKSETIKDLPRMNQVRMRHGPVQVQAKVLSLTCLSLTWWSL